MWEGICAALPGEPLSSVGAAIERFAKRNGLGIVRAFTGHGIGRAFHEAPSVKNFYDPLDTTILVPGMCITIEPMLCLGNGKINILTDGWTVVTADKTLCAQWEHTLAITENGPEVLTLSEMNPKPDRFA
jgi:methionyl aminopeptidase